MTLDPRQLESLPDNTEVLLVAAPAPRYDGRVGTLLAGFVDGGGSLLWLHGDAPLQLPGLAEAIDVLPGRIVDATAAQYGLDNPDNAIVTEYPALLAVPPQTRVLPRSRALQWLEQAGWQLAGQLRSSPRSWNETGALSGRVSRDAARGEQAGPLTVGLALQRVAEGTLRGRVAVVGGGAWLGNAQIGNGGNLALATGLVHWLSGNTALAAPAPAADLKIRWSPMFGSLLAIGLMAVLPLLYLLAGLWLRARRRRA